jgi:amidophosphoribosyltransferase
MGLVHEVFNRDTLEALRGSTGIGHIRYSTRGTSTVENAQPIILPTHDGGLAIGQNGDIVNYQRLRKRLQQDGVELLGNADTEVAGNFLVKEYENSHNMESAIKRLMSEISGGYAFVMLHGDKFYAFRDPLGIRPLYLGSIEGGYLVASESVAIELMGGVPLRDVAPGEIIAIGRTRGKEGETIPMLRPLKGMASGERAYCMFEWVYFSRPDSVVNGTLVYDVRYRIGEILARESKLNADVVIPVPDSSRPQALGLAQASGVPYAEGLIKNRFVERTFILPDQKRREEEVRIKLHPVHGVIKGKRVCLVDDSIVRGTTIREIIGMVRSAGATEVHVRVGSPPIVAPCYFGIDMKDRRDLIAHERTEEEIAKTVGAESVRYLSMAGLVEAIGHPEKSLCVGCLTAKYPIDIPQEHRRLQTTLIDYQPEEKKADVGSS